MEENTSMDDVMSEEMLQKLRNWQQEQKNRLMEQQQHQRLLLMEKQKKLLSMINTGDNSNTSENSSFGILEASNFTPEGECDNKKDNRDSNPRNSSSSHSVDDVPLKKPRSVQTFQQLLETSINTKDQALTSQNTTKVEKFTYLKRGQGISRFGVISKPKIGKSTHSKGNLGKENKVPPITKSTKVQIKEKLPSPLVQSQVNLKPTPVESVQDAKISMEVLPFTAQRVDESLRDVNLSRNEEDLAVFELLERFANINASFSSSSSLIVQLIDKGVTHLPSPSKVINFLSRKQTNILTSNSEEVGFVPERKSGKPSRHVRFADNVEEEQTQIKYYEEHEKPWLTDISEEDPSHASPYVSNTIRSNHHSNEPTSPVRERFDLDETPTSPIGFPDYQKLFPNPARSLWTNEELPSPTTQDESFPKNNNPLSNLSDPVIDQIKGSRNL